MKVIYEDESVIVIHKQAGEPTQTSKGSAVDVVSLIKTHIARQSGKSGDPYVGIIHRLDQPVEGLLVFAKNKKSAQILSRQIQSDIVNKIYTATVEGILPDNSEETLVNYMYKDSKDNRAVIVTDELMSGENIKRAELKYEVLKSDEIHNTTLIRVYLQTGRFHQIRAQLASIGHPIVGDVKYGGKKVNAKGISLIASEIVFVHPDTGEKMHFEVNKEIS